MRQMLKLNPIVGTKDQSSCGRCRSRTAIKKYTVAPRLDYIDKKTNDQSHTTFPSTSHQTNMSTQISPSRSSERSLFSGSSTLELTTPSSSIYPEEKQIPLPPQVSRGGTIRGSMDYPDSIHSVPDAVDAATVASELDVLDKIKPHPSYGSRMVGGRKPHPTHMEQYQAYESVSYITPDTAQQESQFMRMGPSAHRKRRCMLWIRYAFTGIMVSCVISGVSIYFYTKSLHEVYKIFFFVFIFSSSFLFDI